MQHISRRDFLLGASSALALSLNLQPAEAFLMRGGLANGGFNGGKSQGQSGSPVSSPDYPFLNYLHGGNTWQGTDAINNNQKIDPSWLAADGWPLASALQAHSTSGFGVFLGVGIPPQSSYTGTNGNLRLVWTVTGAGPSDTVQWGIGLMSVTPVSGSLISTGNGTFSYVFTPSYNTGNSFNINLASLNGTAHVTSAALVFDGADYAAYQAGKIFSTQFLTRLAQANFGVYRFMDWLGSTNVSNVTTWAMRKTQSYVTWADDEYRANLSAGVTSGNSGNDYAITVPGTYVWPGYTTGGAAVNKQTMHLRLNADSTFVNNSQADDGTGGNFTLTITSLSPLTFNWPSNPLVNGNAVCLATNQKGGDQILGTSPNQPYYVVGTSGDNFNLALTPGGSAISASSSGAGFAAITQLPTLTIDGVNKIPLLGPLSTAINSAGQMPIATFGSSVQIWITLTYDAVLNCWLMAGGNSNVGGSAGIQSLVPLEVCLELCKELGMHPHWSLPGLALDPPTDYATSLANYCKANNPGWMIPHWEPGNEIWNGITPVSTYAAAKAFAYWGTSGSLHDWYGMVLSIMGQGVASVYGAGNLGTTYEVMCGVKTGDGLNPPGGSENPRLGPSQWTIQNQPAQSGYTISQANSWASSILPATYIAPSMRGTIAEFVNAWNYEVTFGANPGNSSAMQCLNNFVDTLGGTASFNPGPNNAATLAWYQGFQAWAAGFGINKMFAYEGGYSPDLLGGNSGDWTSPITGATKASQCVLTLATTTGGESFVSVSQSGNPAIVGMCLGVSGIFTGMTQLNTASAGSGPTFTIGQSVISLSNSFVANQGIVFRSNGTFGEGTPLPTNIEPDTPYFILAAGLSSSQFQISATKGGSPITFTAPSGVTSIFANIGWATGWMVTNVSGNSVTIDCDSSAFGTFTASGNFATVDYLGSKGLCNDFRVATLQYASDLPALLLANYNNFTSAGGLYPSQYQFANNTSVWAVLIPDVYATTTSQQFDMIAAYNH